MSANSKIEWCDHTFNPWIGCTKVSPGCAHCYAEARDQRFAGGVHWGKGAARKLTSEANWREPLKWNAAAQARRPRVFCASLADWLDDEVPAEWLARLLALIHATPNLDWLLLTKRPQNWRARLQATMDDADFGRAEARYFVADWRDGNPPANVWLGTTVEDQARADERIPQLLAIPAKVRFLSCEPLLGPLNLSEHLGSGLDVGLPMIDQAEPHAGLGGPS
jgi:protein gp37